MITLMIATSTSVIETSMRNLRYCTWVASENRYKVGGARPEEEILFRARVRVRVRVSGEARGRNTVSGRVWSGGAMEHCASEIRNRKVPMNTSPVIAHIF